MATLALSPLSFAFTLENATLASSASLSLGSLSFSYTVSTNSVNYSAENFEFLMAPLSFFVDVDTEVIGNQLNMSALAWQWQPQSIGLIQTIVQPLRTRSAWTADSALVTADSINFTCDGADLINNGGVPIFEILPGQSSNRLAYSISVPLFVQLRGNN
jgi:hypothetical protein